jgi:Domain of unknown function (DUF1840)
MIYRFKSKATGDTIMLGPTGDAMLRALGREPSAKGIIEPQVMPQAVDALLRAMDEDSERRAQAAENSSSDGTSSREPISLKQRLWPMVEMLHRAHAANEPIVWGV